VQWLKNEVHGVLLNIEQKLDQLGEQGHRTMEVPPQLPQCPLPHLKAQLRHQIGQNIGRDLGCKVTPKPKVAGMAMTDQLPPCPSSADGPVKARLASVTSSKGSSCTNNSNVSESKIRTSSVATSSVSTCMTDSKASESKMRSSSVAARLESLRQQDNDGNVKNLQRMRNRSHTSMYVWEFLEDPQGITGGRSYHIWITSNIIASVLLSLAQTFTTSPVTGIVPALVEVMFDAVFSIEVLVRFYVCPSKAAFFTHFYNLVDMVTGIMVLVLRIAAGIARPEHWQSNVQWTILLCVVPLLRLLKLLRRFQTVHLLSQAFQHALEALPALLYTLCIIVLTAAVMIYFVEPESNVASLPDAIWFAIVTSTTVGYGDIVPKTKWGKFAASLLTLTSALYMAIPLGIVGSAFSTVWADRDRLTLMHRTSAQLRQAGYTSKDVPHLFRLFDADQDRYLNYREFRRMIVEMHVGLSEDRIADLFHAFDGNSSGLIDEREFMKVLFPSTITEALTEGFLPNEWPSAMLSHQT